jgi:soluble lytic murein transglycosylase-like protein
LIWAESSGNSNALRWETKVKEYSHGLVQILGTTALDMGFIGNKQYKPDETFYYPGLLDPNVNINLGVKYLKLMYDTYKNIYDAISAYNQGPKDYLKNSDGTYKNQSYVTTVSNKIKRFRLILSLV